MQSARSHSWEIGRWPLYAWLLCLAVVYLATPAHGQSLGDIARQERARKASQPQPQQPVHVYDNDDLARQQILLPEDRDRIEAAGQPPAPSAPATAQSTAQPATAAQTSAGINAPITNSAPLGEIARYYRVQKAARQPQPQTAQQISATGNSPQSSARTTNPSASASTSAPSASPGPQFADSATPPRVTYISNAPDANAPSLGDIARYYRALKAARQQQESQSAEQHPTTPAPSLAYPNFTNPPAHTSPKSVPLRTGATPIGTATPAPSVQPAPDTTSAPENPVDGSACLQIRRGDTLWNLARKFLGHGTKWPVLAANNSQLRDPARLQVGTWVRLPAPKDMPDSGPGPTQRVRVERGDSLWKLSQAHFGDGRGWGCIAQANPQLQNPNLIYAGDMLTLPGSCVSLGTLDFGVSASSTASFPDANSRLP